MASVYPVQVQPTTSSKAVSGIHGQLLEVTVVGCSKLKDKEWISRQDPYVTLEYGNTKFRTRTCTDGGKNPTFQEKHIFMLIDGIRELNVGVWNNNTFSCDDFIGGTKVQLQKVISKGYDDMPWPIHSNDGRSSGEIRLILHYESANKSTTSFAPSAPSYFVPAAPPQVPPYAAFPALIAAVATYPPATPYTAPFSYPPVYQLRNPIASPPNPYPLPPQPSAYPTYPPQPYPPPPQAIPSFYPPGPYPP